MLQLILTYFQGISSATGGSQCCQCVVATPSVELIVNAENPTELVKTARRGRKGVEIRQPSPGPVLLHIP